MKASELRIGNYIQDKNGRSIEILKVAHIGEEMINYWMESAYQSIPITEEWLLKFGFEKDEYIQQDWSYALNTKARVSLVYYKGDPSCFSIYHDDKPLDFPGGRVTYVHQLQNLYFALTGTELTIKEGKEWESIKEEATYAKALKKDNSQ